MSLVPSRTGRHDTKWGTGTSRPVWCALIGLVILLVAIAFIFSHSKQEKPPVESAIPKASAIKETEWARTTNIEPVAAEKPTLTYRDEKGVLRYKNGGARAFDPDAKAKKINYGADAAGNPTFKRSIFKNVAENEIARLITMRLGDSMIGMRRYDERFEREFKKSLETPIVVSKDDAPEDAELKRDMIAVKIEICDRLAEGETLKDILDETRSELQRLARVKRAIQQEVLAQTSGGLDDGEVQAYIDAANILLEREGIAPIKGGPILRRNLIMHAKGE